MDNVGNRNFSLRVFNVSNGGLVHNLSIISPYKGTQSISGLVVAPIYGKYVIKDLENDLLKFYNLSSSENIPEFEISTDRWLGDWSDNGEVIALIYGNEGNVDIIRYPSGEKINTIKLPIKELIY